MVQSVSPTSSIGNLAPLTKSAEFDRLQHDRLADTFQKKVGDWAFHSHFLSAQTSTQTPLGRFDVQPPDALIMNYIEQQISQQKSLPTGHLYAQRLREAIMALQNNTQANELLAVLEADSVRWDYFNSRRFEQVLS